MMLTVGEIFYKLGIPSKEEITKRHDPNNFKDFEYIIGHKCERINWDEAKEKYQDEKIFYINIEYNPKCIAYCNGVSVIPAGSMITIIDSPVYAEVAERREYWKNLGVDFGEMFFEYSTCVLSDYNLDNQ